MKGSFNGPEPVRSVAEAEYEASCDLVYSAVGDLVNSQLMRTETEYNGEKMSGKIWEYLKKAKKASEEVSQWQAVIDEFCHHFYSSLYCGLADGRPVVDTADCSLVICLAVKSWRAGVIASVNQDEFMAAVGQACTIAHDVAVYFAKAWDVGKEIITGKKEHKKVMEAVDSAREKVIKAGAVNVDHFISAWIQGTIELIAKGAYSQNPKNDLTEAKALVLFEGLIQRGRGVPQWLNAMTPPPNSPEVANVVQLAYSAYPDPKPRAPWAPKGDKGDKGYGKGGPKGCGKWGGGGGNMNNFMAEQLAMLGKGGFDPSMMEGMMSQMSKMMGGMGGMGGMDGCGGCDGKGVDQGWCGWDGKGGGKGGGKGWDGCDGSSDSTPLMLTNGSTNGWDGCDGKGGGKGWAPY